MRDKISGVSIMSDRMFGLVQILLWGLIPWILSGAASFMYFGVDLPKSRIAGVVWLYIWPFILYMKEC